MALLVFSAVATADSEQSDMRFSLSHQRATNILFLDYSTHHRQFKRRQAGSELCLPFNPSSPDWHIPARPENHAHFRREIESTVNRGCLMLKNPIKSSPFLLALLLSQIANLNFSPETYSG